MVGHRPRFIKWCEEILYEHGPMTVGDLMLKLKVRETHASGNKRPPGQGRKLRNLPTFKYLSNALAKYRQFIVVGTIQVQSKLNPNHHYRVLLYGLAEGHGEEE